MAEAQHTVDQCAAFTELKGYAEGHKTVPFAEAVANNQSLQEYVLQGPENAKEKANAFRSKLLQDVGDNNEPFPYANGHTFEKVSSMSVQDAINTLIFHWEIIQTPPVEFFKSALVYGPSLKRSAIILTAAQNTFPDLKTDTEYNNTIKMLQFWGDVFEGKVRKIRDAAVSASHSCEAVTDQQRAELIHAVETDLPLGGDHQTWGDFRETINAVLGNLGNKYSYGNIRVAGMDPNAPAVQDPDLIVPLKGDLGSAPNEAVWADPDLGNIGTDLEKASIRPTLFHEVTIFKDGIPLCKIKAPKFPKESDKGKPYSVEITVLTQGKNQNKVRYLYIPSQEDGSPEPGSVQKLNKDMSTILQYLGEDSNIDTINNVDWQNQ
jgi:hypothetical protein